MPITAEEEWT